MNIIKFYEIIGGNYKEVKARFLTDERIEKYLRLLPNYIKMDELRFAIENKDYKSVFEISHDIKGMCLNLDLTPAIKSCADLCNAVRNGEPTVDITDLFSLFEKNISYVFKTLEIIEEE